MARRNREKYNAYMRKWFKGHPGYYSTDERREYMRNYMRKLRAQRKEQKVQEGQVIEGEKDK